jgi:hypothetical protein
VGFPLLVPGPVIPYFLVAETNLSIHEEIFQMTYLVQTTKSYTFVLSEDGKATLSLSDDIASALSEKLANGLSVDDMTGVMLDLMGEDATAYLSALGAATGQGGDLAAIHAKGGADALGAHLQGLAEKGHGAFSGGAFQADPNAAFSSGLFERMGASDALALAFGNAGVTVSGDDKTDGVLLDALMEKAGQAMQDSGSDGGFIGFVSGAVLGGAFGYWAGGKAGAAFGAVVGGTVGYMAGEAISEASKKWEEPTGTVADDLTFLPEDPTGEDSDLTLAEALAQRPGSDPGTDPWTQPTGPVDENGNPVDPLDADDLDQTTMPVDPVGDHVAALGPEHLDGHLDPWINPGQGAADEFHFVDGLGPLPDSGLTHLAIASGSGMPSMSLGSVNFQIAPDPGQVIVANAIDALFAADEMIF